MARTPGEETGNAAAAFEQYYDLGEKRSLELLARTIYKNQSNTTPAEITILGKLKKWSSKYDWQKQLVARERVVAEERRKKLEKEIEAMNERQAMIGTTQQSRALKQVEELIKNEKFGALATVNLLKLAIEVEREARGASISKVELSGPEGGPIQTNGIAIYLPQKDEEK
jgi:hypothetical protein